MPQVVEIKKCDLAILFLIGGLVNNEISRIVNMQVTAALWDCCPSDFIEKIRLDGIMPIIENAIYDDAIAFSKKDPASKKDPIKVIAGYTSFRAVLHYRIANMTLRLLGNSNEVESYASVISSRGKLLSGAEIHHCSTIGRRLILDHGVGTVIGETSVIGDDCYILGGVTLGASGIAGNPSGKRHPTIGNRVQIGAYSRIFGNISVGDDVFIGPNCLITKDIPPRTRVTLKASLQFQKECAHDALDEQGYPHEI
jgi:serine O-acetyltransferase